MSKNKTFTGPLAEHIQRFLNEKRSLGYKYEEQERVLYVLDQMSKQFDCSNGLPKNLCLAFIERDPNWRQKTLQIAAYYGQFCGAKRPQCGAERPGFLLI